MPEPWADLVGRRRFPRVVATDLDGTLLGSDGRVSPRTAAALAAYVARGGEYVLVTARPPRWLRPLTPYVPAGGVVLASNGAFVVDVAADELVEVHPFDRDATVDLVQDLKAAFPGMLLGLETAVGLVSEPGFAERADGENTVVADLPGWVSGPDGSPVGKLLARCAQIAADDLYDVAGAVVGDRGLLAYSGAAGLLELGPPGVTKAAALHAWCAARGVCPEEVWAFGDMPNDLPMLAWAGTAFAVANAHEEVLALADAVTEHHDADGVARVLEAALGIAGAGRDGGPATAVDGGGAHPA